MRYAGEGQAVVGVYDEEGGPPREGEQVPRVQAAVLLDNQSFKLKSYVNVFELCF